MGTESLAESNSVYAQARASALDSAITRALASKVPAAPPPKAKTPAAPPAPAAPVSDAGTPPGDPAPPTGIDEALADAAPAAVEPESADALTEPESDSAESDPAPAVDVKALEALAKKKDLRAIEKQLGLTEGVLGATNGEYAALRRRQDEVAAHAQHIVDTHIQNQQKLIDKFGPTAGLIEKAQQGDIRAYIASVERTTGIRFDRIVQAYAAQVQQLSPREVELERENALLRTRSQPPAPAEAPPQTADASVEAATKRANEYIGAEVKSHPALKLKGGLDEVRAKWLGSFDKASQSFKLSPAAAANAVIADRKKAHEQEQWLLAGKTPPKPAATRTLSRTGASEARVRKPENLSDRANRDRAIEIHATKIRQAKAKERLGR